MSGFGFDLERPAQARRRGGFLPLLGLLCLALPAAAQQIGTVASEAPRLEGTPPGAATRALSVGTLVVQDETIRSSAEGRGQLMFLDETTLSIGPNTTIILDRFVFDPATRDGALGLRLTTGTLRFIGGALSDDEPAVITTPSATIGIRGSTALVRHRDGATEALFIAGDRLCADFGDGETCTSRQGGLIDENGYQGTITPEGLRTWVTSVDGAPVPGAGPGSGAPGLGTGGRDPNLGAVSTGGASFDGALFEEDTESDIGLRDAVTQSPPSPPTTDPEPEPEPEPTGREFCPSDYTDTREGITACR